MFLVDWEGEVDAIDHQCLFVDLKQQTQKSSQSHPNYPLVVVAVI